MSRPKPRACVYVRISDDKTGRELGVKRQETDCRKLCKERGWEVHEVFSDNSISAFSGERRPAFEEMLDRVSDGEFDAVVAYHVDRLYRRIKDLSEIIERVPDGVEIATVKAGDLDLSNSTGRTYARFGVVIAQGESERMGERISRQREQARGEGEWTGGKRPFGYDRVPSGERLEGEPALRVNESEAAWVRKWADGVLAGQSLRSMAQEANAAGLTTSQGSDWSGSSIGRLLRRGVIAGMVEHNGEIERDGNWEPIVDLKDWDQIRHVLNDPRRKPADNTAKWFLSGIAECGKCGNKLHQAPNRSGTPGYICRATDKYRDACGGVRIACVETDELVRDFLSGIVDNTSLDEMVEEEGREGDLLQQLRRNQEAWDRAFEMFNEGQFSEREFSLRREKLKEERALLKENLIPSETLAVRTALGGNSLAESWDLLELAQKRQIAKLLLDTVVVGPATVRGSKKFEHERVTPYPKGMRPSGAPSPQT